MDNAGRVRVGESGRDADRTVEQRAPVARRPDRLAVDVLHDEIVGADVVEVTDVRMIQRRDRAALALEAFREGGLRELQGDWSVDARVARLPDLAHSADAKQRHELVRPEPLACTMP
jgi:hypothetical protein